MVWAFLFPIFIVGLAIALANHRKAIEDQAYLDRLMVIKKYAAYSKLYHDYHFGNGEQIICYDKVEEARRWLLEAAEWYNKKYKFYGFCIPPEILNFEEE